MPKNPPEDMNEEVLFTFLTDEELESFLRDDWVDIATTATNDDSSSNNTNDSESNVNTNQKTSGSLDLLGVEIVGEFITPNGSSSSMTSDDDYHIVADANQPQENTHREELTFMEDQLPSPWSTDSSLDSETSHQDMVQMNQTGVAVAPQMAAALQRNDIQEDSNSSQTTSQQSPSLPVVADPSKAVCFGWIKHDVTKKWRTFVKQFSDDRTNYVAWSDEICDEVKALLEKEKFTTFLVCECDGGNRRQIFDGKELRGTWREATKKEVLERTKQRFRDDRSPSKKRRVISPPTKEESRSTIPTSPNSSSTESMVNVQQAAAVASRHPVLPSRTGVTASCAKSPPFEVKQGNVSHNMPLCNFELFDTVAKWDVCFEWDNHFGTVLWREVVRRFSANKQAIQTWNDDIAGQINQQLQKEGIVNFLVFLNCKGKPCLNIRDGLWYRATAEKILEKTREEFNRQQSEEESSSDDGKKPPAKPSSGGSNGDSSSSEDSHSHDGSNPASSDKNSKDGSSKPSSTGGSSQSGNSLIQSYMLQAAPDILESLAESIRQMKLERNEENVAIPFGACKAETSTMFAEAPCSMDESAAEEVLVPEEQCETTDSKIVRAGMMLLALSSTVEGKEKVDTQPNEMDVSTYEYLLQQPLYDAPDSAATYSSIINDDNNVARTKWRYDLLVGDDDFEPANIKDHSSMICDDDDDDIVAETSQPQENNHQQDQSFPLVQPTSPQFIESLSETEPFYRDMTHLRQEGLRNDETREDKSIFAVVSPESINVSVFYRTPFYPVLDRDVCFDWDAHPGTMIWRQVVASFSADKQAFPTWTDDIAELVEEQLKSEDIHDFLVLLTSEGKPCLDFCNGVWYGATADEVLEKTREEFNRQRLEEEASSDDDKKPPAKPSSGGSNSDSSSSWDSCSPDDSYPASSDQDSNDRSSKPSSAGGSSQSWDLRCN